MHGGPPGSRLSLAWRVPRQVDDGNKREYVDLVAEHRMTTAIRAQTQAFLKGFWDMVPKVGPAAPSQTAAAPQQCGRPWRRGLCMLASNHNQLWGRW